MYDTAQNGLSVRGTKAKLGEPSGGLMLTDLILVLCVSPGKTRAESGAMLARVRSSGIFELLTVAAWARALGYPPDELSGKSLRDLMQLEKPAAGKIFAALLDEKDAQPLEVTLRCKDERRKCFRFYRRFDPYEEAVFVLADELPEERLEPLPHLVSAALRPGW